MRREPPRARPHYGWIAFVLGLAFTPGAAWTQDSGIGIGRATAPGYYRVTGVDSDDALNVRSGPGVGSRIIGRMAPEAAPVEVVEVRTPRSTSWGRVAWSEGSGWVSMRYLEPIEVEGVADSELPAQAICGGTEPFWGLTFDDATAVLDEPFLEPRHTRFPIAAAITAAGRFQPVLLSLAEGRGHLLVERGVCSDGMSDIPHGWFVHVILAPDEERPEPRLLSGCCRVPLDPSPAD